MLGVILVPELLNMLFGRHDGHARLLLKNGFFGDVAAEVMRPFWEPGRDGVFKFTPRHRLALSITPSLGHGPAPYPVERSNERGDEGGEDMVVWLFSKLGKVEQ